MPDDPVIDYYFAPMSGYAYLGHARFVTLAATAGAQVVYHPLDMARVFAAAGSFPPAKYPQVRQHHRKADMARWAARFDLPINTTPKHWPVPMALACRVISAAEPGQQPAVTEAILSAVWVHDLNISDEAEVAEALTRQGLDPAPIMARANTPGAAQAAEAITDAAIEQGLFGSPTYAYDAQWYFGQDRLDFLQDALGVGA